MSSRPLLAPFSVITNGDMSGNLTSIPTIIQMLPGVSYSLVWTGTPTGIFSLQGSNDYAFNSVSGHIINPGTWNDLPLSVSPAAAGVADNGLIEVLLSNVYAVRVVYTFTAGTGVLNAVVVGKVT